ncbi:B-cell receptor CD22-like [Engraulis encrasicolus]|uniref:B-cell receptor CD22-like n=1 Tax=Engraulis encrasicolus TaxID=184585 RepID=UPI002FD73046
MKENHQTTTAANQLHLQPVSREDRGNYTCSLKGHEKYPSSALVLDVQYPPENVSLSVVPSTERMEGDSVTLTCSSDANPPVHSYRWFKFKMDARHIPVESSGENKEQLNITNMMPTDGGSYYCEAENSVGVANSTEVSIIGCITLWMILRVFERYTVQEMVKKDEYENQYNNVGIHGAGPQGHAPGGSEEQGVNSNPVNPRTK